jgi:hypothetical protein
MNQTPRRNGKDRHGHGRIAAAAHPYLLRQAEHDQRRALLSSKARLALDSNSSRLLTILDVNDSSLDPSGQVDGAKHHPSAWKVMQSDTRCAVPPRQLGMEHPKHLWEVLIGNQRHGLAFCQAKPRTRAPLLRRCHIRKSGSRGEPVCRVYGK